MLEFSKTLKKFSFYIRKIWELIWLMLLSKNLLGWSFTIGIRHLMSIPLLGTLRNIVLMTELSNLGS